jgi:hypothetical protein
MDFCNPNKPGLPRREQQRQGMRELFGGMHLKLFRDRHVLSTLEHLRVDHVGDDRLVLSREVFVQVIDQLRS